MLFVGFCGRFLRRTPDLSKHDLNEYAVNLRRSLGANRVRRDLPSLVARETSPLGHRLGLTSKKAAPLPQGAASSTFSAYPECVRGVPGSGDYRPEARCSRTRFLRQASMIARAALLAAFRQLPFLPATRCLEDKQPAAIGLC
jgi:hypothetical protein